MYMYNDDWYISTAKTQHELPLGCKDRGICKEWMIEKSLIN